MIEAKRGAELPSFFGLHQNTAEETTLLLGRKKIYAVSMVRSDRVRVAG